MEDSFQRGLNQIISKMCPKCGAKAEYYTASNEEISIEKINCKHCGFCDYVIY